MELNLVSIKNKKTGRIIHYAVNDKHYDAMLAGGGELDLEFEWKYLGDVIIEEPILYEEGYRQHGG